MATKAQAPKHPPADEAPTTEPWLECPGCHQIVPPTEHDCPAVTVTVESGDGQAEKLPVKVGQLPAPPDGPSPSTFTFPHDQDPFVGAKVGEARDMEQPHP